jgi:hypothetical protein
MKLFAATLLAAAPAQAKPVRTIQNGVDLFGTITPRQLVNGRAACGNTASKGQGALTSCAQLLTIAETALLNASSEYRVASAQRIVIEPRLLANYRPACGNTGGKSDEEVNRPKDCGAADMRAIAAYDSAYATASQKHNDRVSAAYGKLMRATEAAIRADPSLKMRLLENGRPACGNTQGKKGPPEYCRLGGDDDESGVL